MITTATTATPTSITTTFFHTDEKVLQTWEGRQLLINFKNYIFKCDNSLKSEMPL